MAFGAFATGIMPSIFSSLAAGAIKETLKKKPALARPPGDLGPASAPAIDAAAERVAAAAAPAVVEAISNNPNVILTKVKPMTKSWEGWAALTGGITVLGTNLPAIMQAIGIPLNSGLADALEAITSTFGLPRGTGRFVVVVVTVGAFVVVWVRKKWFTYTVTPAAATRAAEQGKAV